MSENIAIYLRGEKLYGDDFSPEEIEQWFTDEREAYANLGARERSEYRYSYHRLNWVHGYAYIGRCRLPQVLGLGSAWGDEFAPIINLVDSITILDPSDAFQRQTTINGVPCRYEKPDTMGAMHFGDATFDLITSFGTLHHIPNVSRVVQECARCLKPGGIMLLREPIVSMGDWRRPRGCLTKRERGIPINIFDDIIEKAGLSVRRRSL
jgi:SAM-dependent methyltransferase